MQVDFSHFAGQTSPEAICRSQLAPWKPQSPPLTLLHLSPARSTVEFPQPPDSPDYMSSSTQSERDQSRFYPLKLHHHARIRNRNFTQSAIHKLPPDVLGTIFEYVCLSRPKKAYQRLFWPTALGSICAYWHHVAWSTSRIWTHLRLDYTFWRAGGRNRLVKLYVQNSGGLGLCVEIRHAPIADGRGGTLGIPGGDVFDLLFLKYPHKVEFVEFSVYVSSWLLHIGEISRLGHFSNLTRLGIKDNRDLVPVAGTSFSIYNSPKLREVTLDGLAGDFQCPWIQLTHLTLAVIPSDDAFSAIRYSTNLRSLRCLNLIYQDIWQPDIILDSAVTFPYLEKVVWESTVPLSASWNEVLIHWFIFPSLRTLIFKMPITVVKQPSNLLLNLPKSISSLSLQIDLRNLKEAQTCIARRLRSVKAANIDILRGILSSTPDLSTLTLQCNPVFDHEIVNMLVLRGANTDLVPALQELVLVAESSWTLEAFATFLRVVGSRRWEGGGAARPLETVGIVVPTLKSVERWPHTFLHGVGKLVQHGLRVIVYVKGEGAVDVDWFTPLRSSALDVLDESTSSWESEL